MGLLGSVGNFVSNAVKTAGKPFHSAVSGLSKVTGAITKEVGKVPLVGPALHGTIGLTIGAPISIADKVVSGKRIDKVALESLKDSLQNVREVGPYAQTIISIAPGVGPGVSGVIGAGLAISEGRTLTDSIKQGVLDSVPGGPIARGLAQAGLSAMEGKSVKEVGIEALPVSEQTKALIKRAIVITRDVANGKTPDPSAVSDILLHIPGGGDAVVKLAKANHIPVAVAAAERSFKILTPEQQKALKIGLSVGHAVELQKVVHHSIGKAKIRLSMFGANTVNKDKELHSIGNTLKAKTGFHVGVAVMQHSGVGPGFLKKLRASLPRGEERKGFDIALATHIGRVTSPQAKGPPDLKAGYYAVKGMQGAAKSQVAGMIKSLKQAPGVKAGAKIAAQELDWWTKVKKYFGFK